MIIWNETIIVTAKVTINSVIKAKIKAYERKQNEKCISYAHYWLLTIYFIPYDKTITDQNLHINIIYL